MKKLKIAIFTTRSSLITHPMVYSFLKLLAKDTEEVDLFSEYFVLEDLRLPQNIKNHFVFFKEKYDGKHSFAANNLLAKKWFRYFYYRYLRNFIKRIKEHISIIKSNKDKRRLIASDKFINMIDNNYSKKYYDFVIGIGHQGLILAYLSFKVLPLIYLSDEIYYEGHPEFSGPRFLLEKKLEREAFRRVALIIIQDEDRAKLLYKDNLKDYNLGNVVFFPVSFLGKAELKRSNFFRNRFSDIGKRKILLQHGSLTPHRRTNKLLEVSKHCPDHYALVFHGNWSIYLHNSKLKAHCWISQPDVPLENLSKVASGADIGLVFYQNNNDNDRLIAHSSGQLALFLKCGVPVIVNNVGSLAPLIHSWQCGIVVEHEKDIYDAADCIISDYDKFCRKAILCFQSNYTLEQSYYNIQNRLMNILDE